MIVFKNIKYKNFLSTGNIPIEIQLDKAPTTLIVGANGSGKSTLLDALCFGLFNKPFRMIKKEQMINSINQNDCLIEIEFEIGTKQYKIIRGIKPSVFEIYSNGQLLNQNANNVDYQKYLENNIMKLNYRSFLQVVLLGSSSYEPFMKMKPRYRREVVEEILDIRVFGLMDLILRSQQSDITKEITEMRHRCDLIEQKYDVELKHYNQISDLNTNDIDGKKKLLEKNEEDNKKYSEQIQKLNEEILVTKNQLQDKEQVETKLKQLSKMESKIEHNLESHKKNLQFFQDNDNCLTCTQKLETEFRGEKIAFEKGKVTVLEDGMKKLVEEITKVETKITEMDKVSKKLNELHVDTAKVNTSITELNRHSNRIHEEIKLLENKQTDGKKVELELQKLKDDLEVTKKDRDRIIEQKGYVDILREILNDKGAKAKIIKKYLPIMNGLINQYLQDMDFFVNFELDEEFNETIKSRFRDTFIYNSFSEGEKMRIDLALLFTWRTIAKMKNSTNTNLLILDEIFDSSLDGQGTDDFFKIVSKLKNENIFIISHKGDIMFDKFTNIVKYEKYKNFTRLQQT